jgi:hypothetical protein
MTVNQLKGNSVDVSLLDNGIYSIRIVMEDRTVINRKVTILREIIPCIERKINT